MEAVVRRKTTKVGLGIISINCIIKEGVCYDTLCKLCMCETNVHNLFTVFLCMRLISY